MSVDSSTIRNNIISTEEEDATTRMTIKVTNNIITNGRTIT